MPALITMSTEDHDRYTPLLIEDPEYPSNIPATRRIRYPDSLYWLVVCIQAIIILGLASNILVSKRSTGSSHMFYCMAILRPAIDV